MPAQLVPKMSTETPESAEHEVDLGCREARIERHEDGAERGCGEEALEKRRVIGAEVRNSRARREHRRSAARAQGVSPAR